MAGRAADWDAIKARWEAGENLSALARNCKRPKAEIEKIAAREGWNDSRRDSPQHRTHETIRKSARVSLTEPILVPVETIKIDPSEELDAAAAAAQHLADFQAVRSVAMQYLAKIDSFQDQVIPRMITSIAGAIKTVQDGQRKSLQMDAKTIDDGTIEQAMAEIDRRSGIIPITPSEAHNRMNTPRSSDDD